MDKENFKKGFNLAPFKGFGGGGDEEQLDPHTKRTLDNVTQLIVEGSVSAGKTAQEAERRAVVEGISARLGLFPKSHPDEE